MEIPKPLTLTARWIFPVDRPPLERGTITIADGRIAAVEEHGKHTADVDLGNAAILPGFVNAHAHLDLSGLRGKCPPGPDFIGWLHAVIKFRRMQTPESIEEDVRTGLAECAAAGTTLVGDISYQGLSWPILKDASMRSIVFYELLGLPKVRAALAWDAIKTWSADKLSTKTCRPGVSPHAPYSVRSQLCAAASLMGVPVAIHLAETVEERQLLRDHSGPFADFLRDLGVWEPDGLVNNYDELMRLYKGLVPVLFIHANYLSGRPNIHSRLRRTLPYAQPTVPGSMNHGFTVGSNMPENSLHWMVPIPPNASVIYCPRTHAAFGHAPHPFRDFLARGIRVALGTDSLASNPDLNILSEARFVHQKYPDFPGDALLRMITLSGAEALGWADETGSLTPGKSADLVVLPLPAEDSLDPHGLVFESNCKVNRVMFQGKWQGACS